MELLDKAIPKKDLAAGIGASILVHGLIFGSAIFWVLLIPHKPLPVPYCSVDLVSMKDLGAGMAEPKGETGATGKAVERRVQRRTRSFRKAGPVVPIRRLAVNDNTGTVDTHVKIKQIEPRETPATPERTQGLESIDRNLDKLVARPKNVPHFAPPVARRAEPQPRSGHRASSVAANEPGGRSSKEAATEGEEEPAGGTPTGNARGGRQGSGRGSAFGSPNGECCRHPDTGHVRAGCQGEDPKRVEPGKRQGSRWAKDGGAGPDQGVGGNRSSGCYEGVRKRAFR